MQIQLFWSAEMLYPHSGLGFFIVCGCRYPLEICVEAFVTAEK